MANSNVEKLPSWMIGWFVFGGLVQLWDAFFILLRPHSMPPDGKWSVVWWPYNIYKEIDLNYKNVDDCFTMAVSMMNIVEVVTMFYLVAVGRMDATLAKGLAVTM
ncbi:uncharacterized protein [Diadema antillarum]|uniref:uncharacterized protein n=1 Tax=Diadema antillarum TaxID=105358 RepID=UPI003A8AD54F